MQIEKDSALPFGVFAVREMQEETSNAMQKTYWIHALTPVHVGIGSGTGFIDLPIMREKITDWPLIPGSAVKGVIADKMRATVNERKEKYQIAAFGRADDESNQTENSNAGALVFSDARIVCLAVRSLYGTFAWVTSSMALRRFARDHQNNAPYTPCANSNAAAHVPPGSALAGGGTVYLADLDLKAHDCATAASWADTISRAVLDASWQAEFVKRFAVVPDETFDYLCRQACEVVARVRIEEQRKSVKKGGLWYEEYLPAESILAGAVWCDKVYHARESIQPAELFAKFCKDPLDLQVGGKATVGKGRVRCLFSSAGEKGNG